MRAAILCSSVLVWYFSFGGPLAAEERVDFHREIRPILADVCYQCHGPDDAARQSELRLDKKESTFADLGGYRAIVPGKPDASELIRRITSDDDALRMPPPGSSRELTRDQIAKLTRWIAEGADWPDSGHWAFIPPRRPALPAVKDASWPRNPIDHFILARLEREGLAPADQADRTTLIRRVTLDLTGLPPTLDEIDAFLADNAPDAYERLVDRLLASPRYGEHMALPWLEAARYADTDGYQNDRLRYMWIWRDWVIRALNANMPFDQFTIEQLAGDLLPDRTLYQQIATGFNRNHRINSEAGSIPAEFHVEYVVDRVNTTGTIWLGLTIRCARCHDHKYDPISQREYYQLFAYFNNVAEWGLGPNNGNSPPFIPVPKSWPNLAANERKAIVPKPFKLKTSQGAVQRPNPGGPETVMVMHERDDPRPTYLLERGAYDQPDKSEVLAPGVPQSLGRIPDGFPSNRLGLARWLVDPSNPLTARVIVNRYWQLFFGTGLVKTSENFGIQGESPSHPQLLDWLATEFLRREWNVKAMHRLIVTSATYRQSSRASAELQERDPENRLLARGSRLRLTGHALRDQALAISGLLIEEIGGPPVKPYMPPGLWKSISNNKYKQDHGKKLYRRSLYTYWRRTIPPPTMQTFGAALRETCIVRRSQSTTPLQALTLMNNITFVEASRCLAERMMLEGGSDPRTRLAYGFRAATGRLPNDGETEVLVAAFDSFLARFQLDPAAAKELLGVGESAADPQRDPAELAAFAMAAGTILNLDETITRE